MQSQGTEIQLETFRKSIETSPSYMVEQFVLLHSNYLDDAKKNPQAAYKIYKGKIASIQDLCAAALAHKASVAQGGRALTRHRKTKKKRAQIR